MRTETSPFLCKGVTRALFQEDGILLVKKVWLKICVK